MGFPLINIKFILVILAYDLYIQKRTPSPLTFYCLTLNSMYFSYLQILQLHDLEGRNNNKEEEVEEDGTYNVVSTFYILDTTYKITFSLYHDQSRQLLQPLFYK